MGNDILDRAIRGFSYEEGYTRRVEVERPVKEIEKAFPIRERKNINKLNDDEKSTLISALEESIKSGEYAKLVTLHSQYMFDIHSFGGAAHTNLRFLPWHRVYLVKLEEMLNTTMKQLHPGKEYNIGFPYWDWVHDRKIPDFFLNFKPSMDVEVYLYDENGQQIGSQIFNLQVKRFPVPDLINR